MQTIDGVMRAASARLSAVGIDQPMRDARLLMASALSLDPSRLLVVAHDEMPDEAAAQFEALITRREAREPVSHLRGLREFYGREFRVTPDVLDPRPETESLISECLSESFASVLDLGTGSGAIITTLALERAGLTRAIGADVSAPALEVAALNARALGAPVSFLHSDWFSAVERRFDLIVSNPPYIAYDEMADLAPELSYEPEMALSDGADGLSAYRAICADALRFMMPNARLIVEIGHKQGRAVSTLFRECGLSDVYVAKDLDGRDRVVCGRGPN